MNKNIHAIIYKIVWFERVLKMTGDDNFTQIHIEAALEQCSVFVVLNTTFQETEPEITYTIETFCQNNCSGHGICNAGKPMIKYSY